jgi:GABA permease
VVHSKSKEADVAWTTSVLVIANRTLDSEDLIDALRARTERGPAAFTLLVPSPDRAAGRRMLEAACERMREHGLEVDGEVADADPVVAVSEAWDPGRFDEIVVSTLPTGTSKWLQLDLPHRLERMTGVPVTHVVSHERRAQPAPKPPPEHSDWTALLPKAAREPQS